MESHNAPPVIGFEGDRSVAICECGVQILTAADADAAAADRWDAALVRNTKFRLHLVRIPFMILGMNATMHLVTEVSFGEGEDYRRMVR